MRKKSQQEKIWRLIKNKARNLYTCTSTKDVYGNFMVKEGKDILPQTNFLSMSLTVRDHPLLVKPFYQGNENAIAPFVNFED